MDIVSLANELEDYIIGQRRYFHRFPSLHGRKCRRRWPLNASLRKWVWNLCALMTFPVSIPIYGVKSRQNRKDHPAEPILTVYLSRKKTGLAFSSENAGMMHACGRDCHIAMLLGAAKLLKNMENSLAGHVKLFFQAAEESAESSQGISEGAFCRMWTQSAEPMSTGLEAPYIDISPG